MARHAHEFLLPSLILTPTCDSAQRHLMKHANRKEQSENLFLSFCPQLPPESAALIAGSA